MRYLSFFALLALAGCGLSAEEISDICQEELEARGNTVQASDFDQCTACFDKCGNQCEISTGTPLAFTCPE